MPATLLLDRATNDLCIDALGNIAVATEPYSIVQDAASACRVFYGEAWYDTSRGVPYFDQVFSGTTPLAVLRERLAAEAKRVPGVAGATVSLAPIGGRKLAGQVELRLTNGTVQTAAF